jgi:hypothetical protein
MATNATNARRQKWHRAYSKYADLKLNLAVAEGSPQQLEKLGNALAEQIDLLLELPAPSIAAVIEKLTVMWEADLEKPDRDGAEKLQIIEDLHDLADEARDLIGERA